MSNADFSMIMDIPIKQIEEPPEAEQKRRVEIAKLGDSILAVGMINPITVIAVADNKYRILAGRRRFWACRSRGLGEISCSVVGADNQSIIETIEVTENIHRVQLTPMEEADAIQKLRNLDHSDESIAADLGFTRQFVARRAKLLDLSPLWKRAVSGMPPTRADLHYDEKLIVLWPVGCLELVARYPHERQNQLLDWFGNDTPDLDLLKRELSNYENKLMGAPWKLEDEALYPKAGACSNCPKRTGAQPLLFDDGAKTGKTTKNDRCLDIECWQIKLKRHSEIAITAAKEKYPDAIAVSSEINYTKDRGKQGLAKQDYTAVSKKTKGARLAVFVDGPQAGRTLYVSLTTDLLKTIQSAKKKPLTDKVRAQRLKDRRHKWIIDTIRTRLSVSKKDWPVPTLKTVVAAGVTFGLNIHGPKSYVAMGGLFKHLDKALSMPDAKLCELFWWNFRQDMARKLCVVNTGIIASIIMPTMKPLFDMMGTTFTKLYLESAKEIPDRHNYLKEAPPP